MDALAFTTALKDSLAEVDEGNFTDAIRAAALTRTVYEYSRYRPVLRKMNSGHLYAAAAAGASTLYIVGGLWKVGDVFALDATSPNEETCTVLTSAVGAYAVNQTVPITAVTVSPTVRAHAAGCLLLRAPESGDSAAGLKLSVGEEVYALPRDFVAVEQESFDLAVGAKASVTKGNGFYDAAYGITNQMSGVGWGYMSNYGPGMLGGLYPIAGDPFNNPNSGMGRSVGTIYRFMLSSPPVLAVAPAPTQAAVLDVFYYGMHAVETIPDWEFEALQAYARYVCLTARASEMIARGNTKEADEEQTSSSPVKVMSTLAKEALDEFKRQIRNRPFGGWG